MITTEAIQKNILDSINEVAQRAVNQAKFDITIAGIVVECIDSILGKYKIKYQDAIYYATAENTDREYAKGTEVYVLIPSGDFSKSKKIIGATSKDSESFTIINDKYKKIGKNCLELKKEEEIVLNGSKENIQLYNNFYDFDVEDFKRYLKNSDAVRLSAKFKMLGLNHSSVFNYGLILKIKNKEGKVLSYSFDADNIKEPLINFNNFLNHSIDLPIDIEIFDSIESIVFFQENLKENESIVCTNVEIVCLQKETNNTNSIELILQTPLGDKIKTAEDIVKIEGRVYYKNKCAKVNRVETYWFKENAEVTFKHKDYNRYGGQGWQCLNKIPNKDLIYEINANDVTLLFEQKYKCVCIYNNIILSQIISVYNEDKNILNAYLESSEGVSFSSNLGTTTITCKSLGRNYQYEWSKVSANGTFMPIKFKSTESFVDIEIAELDFNTAIKCAIYNRSNEYIGTISINLIKNIGNNIDIKFIIDRIKKIEDAIMKNGITYFIA